jgi:hypothetical protein
MRAASIPTALALLLALTGADRAFGGDLPTALPQPFEVLSTASLALIDPDPEVNVRSGVDDAELVEEHRQGGVVYLVRVRPADGPDYLLFDADGNGRLDSIDGQPPDGRWPAFLAQYDWE